jgi:alkyl hydroperoxide reductase subunit AhpF
VLCLGRRAVLQLACHVATQEEAEKVCDEHSTTTLPGNRAAGDPMLESVRGVPVVVGSGASAQQGFFVDLA